MKGQSWRIDCPIVLVAWHKLGQGDRVSSLHELNKSASVSEGQGQTKAFLDLLCIWTNKEQVFFIFDFSLSKLQPRQNIISQHMAHPSMHLALPQAVSSHIEIGVTFVTLMSGCNVFFFLFF
jgi:hypothetical protein